MIEVTTNYLYHLAPVVFNIEPMDRNLLDLVFKEYEEYYKSKTDITSIPRSIKQQVDYIEKTRVDNLIFQSTIRSYLYFIDNSVECSDYFKRALTPVVQLVANNSFDTSTLMGFNSILDIHYDILEHITENQKQNMVKFIVEKDISYQMLLPNFLISIFRNIVLSSDNYVPKHFIEAFFKEEIEMPWGNSLTNTKKYILESRTELMFNDRLKQQFRILLKKDNNLNLY